MTTSRTNNLIAKEVLGITIYGGALFVGSCLMFLIEPFVAKLLLPLLGGGPGVWNTSVLFFQITLLLGYLYSHTLSGKFSIKWQLAIHVFVLWLPVLWLPIRAPLQSSSELPPVLWLFCALAGMIGSLFFAISTTAPLLQRWFALAGCAGSSDPYFLFAASNLGGLIGLISYPFLVEPNFSIAEQTGWLSAGYVGFAVLVSLAGCLLYFYGKHSTGVDDDSLEPVDRSTSKPGLAQYFSWLLLTLIPSSLVLGLTTHVTSELSSIPLFWIVPLIIYLISFIVAFGRFPRAIVKSSSFAAPFMVATSIALLASDNAYWLLGGESYITTGISVHLLTLLAVCIACHGKVAEERPPHAFLTAYFLVISLGGVIGSAFNTLLAPMIFKGAEEYSLMLMVAGITLARLPGSPLLKLKRLDLVSSMSYVTPLVVLGVAVLSWSGYAFVAVTSEENASLIRPDTGILEIVLRFAIPVVVCLLLARNNLQLRFGLLSISAVILFHIINGGLDEALIYKNRNFFGRVFVACKDDKVQLWNGVCLHGSESLNPLLRGKPLFYLYTDGPIGQVLAGIDQNSPEESESQSDERLKRRNFVLSSKTKRTDKAPIAVMGLGTGVAAALAKPGQSIVFYEINPQVVDIANNPFFFTYIYEAKKRKVDLKIVTGDARLEIHKAPYNFYRLIISDTYNSSSIPTHMLTKEALQIYLTKLKPEGALAFNLNSYYDLKPVLGRVASELGLQAVTIQEYDRTSSTRESIEWAVLSRDRKLIEQLKGQGWKTLEGYPQFRLWTDDYSNPLELLKVRFS